MPYRVASTSRPCRARISPLPMGSEGGSRKVQRAAIRLGSLAHTVKQTAQGCPPTGAGFRSGGAGVSDRKSAARLTGLSKTQANRLSGVMNRVANQGGPTSPGLTPWLADLRGRAASLLVAAFIALCCGVMWMKIDASEGLQE